MSLINSLLGSRSRPRIEKPPFNASLLKPHHNFIVKPYTVKRPRTQGFGTTSVMPYKNADRNGFLRFNFRESPEVGVLHHTYPLYTFPAFDGTTDFVGAPDGIYTWILVSPPEAAAGAAGSAGAAAAAATTPVFAATQVFSKMELGAGHSETVERLMELRSDLGFVEDSKTKMYVDFSGELVKTGRSIRFNLQSGTYMLDTMDRYFMYNFGARDYRDVLNEIFSERASQELNRLFAGALEVVFNPGQETLITHNSVPVTREELERYVSRGHANAFFVNRSELRANETRVLSTNSRWRPFFEAAAAPAAAAAAAAAPARRSTRRSQRRARRNTRK